MDEYRAAREDIEAERLEMLDQLRSEAASLSRDLLARDQRRGLAYLDGLTPDSPWWVGRPGGRSPERSPGPDDR